MQHLSIFVKLDSWYLACYHQSKGTVFWWHMLHSSKLYWSFYCDKALHILDQKMIQYTKHNVNTPQLTMLQWQHQRASLRSKTKVKSKQNLGLSREEWNQNTENLLIPSVHWIQTKLRTRWILWITLLPNHKAHAWGELHDTLTLMPDFTTLINLHYHDWHYLSLF